MLLPIKFKYCVVALHKLQPVNKLVFSAEIDRTEKGTKYTELHTDKRIKLAEKVIIPVKEHPKVCSVVGLLPLAVL